MRRCPLRSTWLRSRTRDSNTCSSGSRSKKSSPLTQRPADDFMAGASLFDRFVEYCTSTSLLSTVLLTTIPLTSLARWARIVRQTGLGRGRGCLFSSVRPGSSAEAAGSAIGRSRRSPGASGRMRRNRRIRRQGGRPVHCRAATGPAPFPTAGGRPMGTCPHPRAVVARRGWWPKTSGRRGARRRRTGSAWRYTASARAGRPDGAVNPAARAEASGESRRST